MKLSGEHHIDASVDQIRGQFEDPERFKKCLPGCIEIEELEPGSYLATVARIGRPETQVQYLFRIEPGGDLNHFSISWQGTDPSALMTNGKHIISLSPGQGATILSHHSSVELSKNGKEAKVTSSALIAPLTQLFDNVVDRLKQESAESSILPKAEPGILSRAEDAVIELEHEAEEAAARGFLGGAVSWGWIALAILVLLLLIFFE